MDIRALVVDRERVVEVLRRLRVDRERRQLAQIDAPVERHVRRRIRLELLTSPCLDEERLEHVLDPIGGTERPLDTCAAARTSRDDEIAGSGVEPFAIEHQRRARSEERLADDELASAAHLDDNQRGQVFHGTAL